MFLIDDIAMALKGGKLAALAAGAAITLAAGFAAGEAWEHRPHQGFPLSVLGQGLKAQRDTIAASIPAKVAASWDAGAKAQAATDAAAFKKWDEALQACSTSLRTARDTSAQRITAAEALTRAQARTAYNLGRATCGSSNAQTPRPGPGGPPPGGVRPPESDDFGALFNPGAFTPSR
jgi:hypothetical protein